MPLISVIIPVFKVEKYLESCIKSLIAQTLTDIEIILVDDGSPDNSGSICDHYSEKDSRIRVIHQKNMGLSCARNTGISNANGDFICFVDSDDMVSPEYCQVLYDLLKDTDYDFSVCAVCRFQNGKQPTPKGEGTVVWKNDEFLSEQLNGNSEFGVWNKLFHKSLFEDIRFVPGKLHEDVLLSGDLAKFCNKGIIGTKQQLYYYRQHSEGIMGNSKLKCSADFVYAGLHLIQSTEERYPYLLKKCLYYAVNYPWFFVDKIYLNRTFSENIELLRAIQMFVKKYKVELKQFKIFSKVQIHRMRLFSISLILYGINAYGRLLRTYLCRIFRKDPYESGHGI